MTSGTQPFGTPTIGVLNGPNLNLLGSREPELYGTDTLADVADLCEATAAELGFGVDFRQTNHEGVLVDQVHELRGRVSCLVVNAAAYTHTSVALRDALASVDVPVVEVHLTNVHAREAFRHRSLISDVVCAVIAGCGPAGYGYAIRYAASRVPNGTQSHACTG
jgi:3-dehydroquinate dehydratase II